MTSTHDGVNPIASEYRASQSPVRVNCCLTRGLPGDVTERFFALGFSLEQMHRNLRDLERCVTGWAEQSEIPVTKMTDEAA